MEIDRDKLTEFTFLHPNYIECLKQAERIKLVVLPEQMLPASNAGTVRPDAELRSAGG